jgi:hypothetical protein
MMKASFVSSMMVMHLAWFEEANYTAHGAIGQAVTKVLKEHNLRSNFEILRDSK